MNREIIYSGEERPHLETNFEFFLKFALRLAHKAAKAMYSAAKAMYSAVQRIFPPGFDKTIIREE